MGKRRDRMLAAMSNAGRRVKLDLSAEPSGDMVGSTISDEVGKDTESKERAGLPNSPTSSGQQQQNPLLLLGQYSDDEIEGESNDRIQQAVVENFSAVEENQVKGQFDEGSEDKDVIKVEDLASQEVKQQDKDGYVNSPDDFRKPEVSDTRESHITASGQSGKETNFAEETPVAVSSVVQVIGDVSSGWKMVLHEESNQYYYWNTETGETSWEVPQILAQTAELTFDQKTTINENTQTAVMLTHESDSTIGVDLDFFSTTLTSDGSMAANKISQSKDTNGCGPQMDEKVEGCESEVLKDEKEAAVVSQIALGSSSGAVDALPGNGTVSGPEIYIHGSVTKEEYIPGFDLPSDLVKRCEHFLEKLRSLEGSKGHLQGHKWMLKYVLEIEIRLSDLKSLLSHGSSLLPFWLHSERQIERLEGAFNEEIYQLAKTQVDELMETNISSSREEGEIVEKEHESQTEEYRNDATLSAPLISNISSNTDTLTVIGKDLINETSLGITVTGVDVPSPGLPAGQLENGPTIGEQVNGTVLPDESISKPVFHAGEDVDMDVDMEVEDPIPTGNASSGDTSSAKGFTPPQEPIQPNPPAEDLSLASEDAFFAPPPPDEEWIPPPPPDNEQVPPPPPDEPPETLYIATTSYMETGQPLSYTEQYNLSYPNSSFTYYGHAVAEVPNSSFYGHADGSQVDVPHVPVYYGEVPNTYNETASVMVNPIQSVAYYGLQDGTIPSVPVAGSFEPSQNYNESGPVCDKTLASDQFVSVGACSEAEAAMKTDVSAVGETDMGSLGAPSTSATIQAPATVSFKESVSALSTNAVTSATAAAATSSTTKAQSKVRNKKRTVAAAPSLRSNKKVSSLVDKWKAAKEELNEAEEDEPENAYEMLEKKRQREIEEWHAQKIASGEAKDNANFQPLGGDWREKVKRRRAQAAKEAAKTPPEGETDGNQRPNLVDLSKGLPSGWQAYWDETLKQVYYGNTITSETTWTKPKK